MRPLVISGLLLVLLLMSSLAVSACGGGSEADAYGVSSAKTVSSDSVTVEMKNLEFSPVGIRVKPGTTVTWLNKDAVAHNVRHVESAFLSKDEMAEGESFSFRFDKPGTYRYQCTFHHPNMNGVVIVEAK